MARALSICEDGRLLVEEEDGTQSRLSYGEVSLRVKDLQIIHKDEKNRR